jgi:hypothetical protein
MNRAKVIANYQKRIEEKKQTKLKGEEQEFLIQSFVRDLKKLKTEVEIKNRCQEEITLLEKGYSKETVAKTRLNRYRAAIQEAIEHGSLKMTKTNSKKYKYEKKEGTEKTGEIGQAHHHYGWLYMCYDDDVYRGFQKEPPYLLLL